MGENIFEKKNEKNKESSFEEGVVLIFNKIENLLSRKRHVALSVFGPSSGDMNVGKSRLVSEISKRCMESGIEVEIRSNMDSLEASYFSESFKKQGVLILGAMGGPGEAKNDDDLKKMKDFHDQSLKQIMKSVDIPISGIDIKILIYRPDRPITEGEGKYGDFIIKNEKAEDNPRKYR